jgi:ADP-dependent phosphofructokinase/glucokinase
MGKRAVLGLGGTVDYEIVWDSGVIEGLVEEYSISDAELSTAVVIEGERDLVRSLLAFVRAGVGGERFVASSDILEAFASRFERRIALGGTCVRAAIAMDAVGIGSTLHLVSIDDHVRRLLPERCDYLCSAEHDSTDPHLIVQFFEGARVDSGDVHVVAPHPNRIIYVNDPPNRELVLSPDLGEALRTADVVLVSGFNTIRDVAVLDARLATLCEDLRRVPVGGLVVYEDAGFHLPELSDRVRAALVPVVDVHSMNEDEMQATVGRKVDLLDPDDVAEALADLHRAVPARNLVVHTRCWSLALGEDARRYADALLGGITMASARYVVGDALTAADYRAVAERPVNPEGAALASALEERLGDRVRCVPAFRLDVPRPTTIGLGDTFVGGFVAALVATESPSGSDA